MIFVASYLPPSAQITSNDLRPFLVLSSSSEILIGADWNAKHSSWGGSTSNNTGRVLADFLLECSSFEVCPTREPIRPYAMSGSYIDFFLRTPGVFVCTDGELLETHSSADTGASELA